MSVSPGSPYPDPISDQNMPFSIRLLLWRGSSLFEISFVICTMKWYFEAKMNWRHVKWYFEATCKIRERHLKCKMRNTAYSRTSRKQWPARPQLGVRFQEVSAYERLKKIKHHSWSVNLAWVIFLLSCIIWPSASFIRCVVSIIFPWSSWKA